MDGHGRQPGVGQGGPFLRAAPLPDVLFDACMQGLLVMGEDRLEVVAALSSASEQVLSEAILAVSFIFLTGPRCRRRFISCAPQCVGVVQ